MEPVENPPSTFTAGGTLIIITDIIKWRPAKSQYSVPPK
jgi:hypothetical protein